MQYLQHLLDQTQIPVLSAFILGLMMAISPCPLATNITAIAYISREIQNKRIIFLNGLVYTLGRVISYTALGLIIYFGSSTFKISLFFQKYLDKFIGPLLIIVGLFMLDIFGKRLSGSAGWVSKLEGKIHVGRTWGALIMGILFALAFCPYSAVLYFGMLIPMSITSAKGLFLPPVFAFATGLPVIILAWMLAFTVAGVGNFYNRLKTFEYWFRKVVAVVFILAGLYYTYIIFIKPF